MKFKPLYFYAAVLLAIIVVLIIVSQQESKVEPTQDDNITEQEMPQDDIESSLNRKIVIPARSALIRLKWWMRRRESRPHGTHPAMASPCSL